MRENKAVLNRAFTLVEMLIVVIIIGILSAAIKESYLWELLLKN